MEATIKEFMCCIRNGQSLIFYYPRKIKLHLNMNVPSFSNTNAYLNYLLWLVLIMDHIHLRKGQRTAKVILRSGARPFLSPYLRGSVLYPMVVFCRFYTNACPQVLKYRINCHNSYQTTLKSRFTVFGHQYFEV